MANLGGEEYTTQENEMPPPPPPLRPPQVEVQRQNQINQSLPPRPPIFRGRAHPPISRGKAQLWSQKYSLGDTWTFGQKMTKMSLRHTGIHTCE